MHPAFSVIFFTTSSGAGYGMLGLIGGLTLAGRLPPNAVFGVMAFGAALILITAGLLSSTLHLGHPERAWRAFSQWRSSWLAREGVAAVATYLPTFGVGAAWVVLGRNDGFWAAAGAVMALGAIVTVACTGMIYASLKPIPRWNNGWVVPVYLAFALATGALCLAPFTLLAGPDVFALTAWIGAAACGLAWGLKFCYWRHIDRARAAATTARAVGMEHLGEVRMLEGPHSGANFVMREMGYAVARKHVRKLRRISLTLGGGATLLTIASALTSPAFALGLSLLAICAVAIAVLIERWLFFAEAEHLSMLYYGARLGQNDAG